QFTRPGEFHYGCLIPGHFEAGMVGKVRVIQ
ncbi:MAG: plastocyanin/azurin family copper-binding protein, partial [Terriglobales bacterium]